MIASLFRQKLLLCVVGVGVLIAGFFAYRDLPVDAFPDVSPALVQVFTETDGLAPEEVERYVTYPVEVAMAGLPGLKEVRSISNFGLSVVNVYFEDSTDIYFARQLVGERLQVAREEIPAGFGDPEMGPITTGLGQILFYFVVDESGKRSAEEVREIQDWIIKFNLQTVPGVTEVLSLGGEVKQFHVNVRPEALLRYDLSIADIVSAVRVNNGNIGAQYIVKNSEQFLVRSVGLANDIPDIENVVLKVFDGVAVRVRDVATVVDRRRSSAGAGDAQRKRRSGCRSGPEIDWDEHLPGYQLGQTEAGSTGGDRPTGHTGRSLLRSVEAGAAQCRHGQSGLCFRASRWW